MRVVVYGTTGSGKSTFATALAKARSSPFIELDLINWRPGWVGRNETDEQGFIQDVKDAISAEKWVATGSYGAVRSMMWAAASDVVYLDLPRHIIMRQVIMRSFRRIFSQEDVFPGCKETFGRLLDPEHPINWAWATIEKRRRTFDQLRHQPQFSHVTFHHCQSRHAVMEALKTLSG